MLDTRGHRVLFFMKALRKGVKQRQPDISQEDLKHTLGAMWDAASPEEREPFLQQHKQLLSTLRAPMPKPAPLAFHGSLASHGPGSPHDPYGPPSGPRALQAEVSQPT